MTNLACNLIEASGRHPEQVALRLDEIEVPYTGLDAASARFAGLLVARGLRPATGSASCCPTCPTSPSPTTACCGWAGGVVVPMNVLLKERETGGKILKRDIAIPVEA